jgi:hypothetical protein
VNATFTAAGTVVYKCTKCGVTKTDTVSAKGHTSQTVPGTAATCTAAGLTDGAKCSVCGAVITAQNEIPAKGHNVVTVPGRAATCTGTGLTEGSKCSVCGVVITPQNVIPAKGHSYTSETKPATCTENGYIRYTCGCGASYDETLAAHGHSESDWITVREPQAGVPGLQEIKCIVCLKVLKSRETAPLPSYMKGDVDRDGNITATDARVILRIAVGLEHADTDIFNIADFNSDGSITATDARSVLRRAVGLS